MFRCSWCYGLRRQDGTDADPLLIVIIFSLTMTLFFKLLYRDILQTLLDESTNECHLVLQERVKDISFVAGLSGRHVYI